MDVSSANHSALQWIANCHTERDTEVLANYMNNFLVSHWRWYWSTSQLYEWHSCITLKVILRYKPTTSITFLCHTKGDTEVSSNYTNYFLVSVGTSPSLPLEYTVSVEDTAAALSRIWCVTGIKRSDTLLEMTNKWYEATEQQRKFYPDIVSELL